MKRTGAAVLCALLVLATSPMARASCSLAVSLETGVPAPCSGLLVPTSQAQKALLCLSTDLPLCRSKLVRYTRSSALRISALDEQLSIERARATELETLLQLASEPPPERLWWEHPAFWTGVGVIVGAAVMYGAFELAKDIQ